MLEGKDPWLLGYIGDGLCERAENSRCFRGSDFSPYNFFSTGATYAGAHQCGDLSEIPIMDAIAQYIAGFLPTRTMIHFGITENVSPYSLANWARSYHCARPHSLTL